MSKIPYLTNFPASDERPPVRPARINWKDYADSHWEEVCNTCGGTSEWETTTEESPDELVSLGPCPDCATCQECERKFDLTDETQAEEWYYGHDCEA